MTIAVIGVVVVVVDGCGSSCGCQEEEVPGEVRDLFQASVRTNCEDIGNTATNKDKEASYSRR